MDKTCYRGRIKTPIWVHPVVRVHASRAAGCWNCQFACLFRHLQWTSKEFKLHTVSRYLFRDLGADKTVTTPRTAEFNLKFEPRPVIWQLLPKAIPEESRSFWLQNQWASLWHSLGGSHGQAQTQPEGFSESAAVAAGRDQQAWGKRTTNLTILTWFKSRKVLMLCKSWWRIVF